MNLFNPRASARGFFFALSAAKSVHDLDLIAGLQWMGSVRTTRHDRAIDFYGNPTLGQTFAAQQVEDVAIVRERSRFAVKGDIHVAYCRALPIRARKA